MVSGIVGSYLISKGLLTSEQFDDLLAAQQKVRVKLGLIAVAEGLLSQEEADRINQLQAVMDKRFGDIAVEKGYLSERQVASLLKKQGNAYLAFAQALQDEELMTVEQLEEYMLDYRCENQFTASDIEDLKSDDIDRILPLFLPVESEEYKDLIGTAVRTLRRIVDNDIYPGTAYFAEELAADRGALQNVQGAPGHACAFVGNGDAMLPMASVFGQEAFESMNEDALDAVGELLNCINGLYASEKEGAQLELLPPEFSTGIRGLTGRKLLVLPLHIGGKWVDFLIQANGIISMVE